MRRGCQPRDVRRRQLLAVLADGPRTQAEIAERLGLRRPAVFKILSPMLAVCDVRLVPSVRGCGDGPWPLRYEIAQPARRCAG